MFNPKSYLVGQGMSIVSHSVLIDSSIKNDYNSPLRFSKISKNPEKGGTLVKKKYTEFFISGQPHKHIHLMTFAPVAQLDRATDF
jgi:hypothetical protein